MANKSSKLYPIVNLKCPRCCEGDLFETGTFEFNKPFDMHDRCPNCKQNYMPEPGFYYGAMFISYIFTGWLFIGFILFFHWGLGWSTGASFALLLFFVAIFFVWFFRISRSLWLGVNVKYDPAAGKK